MEWASLLNELLEGSHRIDAPPPPAEPALGTTERAALLQAMIVGLLRHFSTTRRLVILLHLKTGDSASSSKDVDIWSWRTARAVSREAEKGRLPVLLCLVTRQVSQVDDGWSKEAQREIEETFAKLVEAAEATHTHVKLKPLLEGVRVSYLVELLQEKWAFSGGAADLPADLVRFMSERGAGNPGYMELVLDGLFASKAIALLVDGLGESTGGMVLRCPPIDELRSVEVPPRMKATLLQQFDSLDAAMQRVLKTVAPLDAFSEEMLVDILPPHIYQRLPHWLNMATDEGILESLDVLPDAVLSADPKAKRAWKWLLVIMKDEVRAPALPSTLRPPPSALRPPPSALRPPPELASGRCRCTRPSSTPSARACST